MGLWFNPVRVALTSLLSTKYPLRAGNEVSSPHHAVPWSLPHHVRSENWGGTPKAGNRVEMADLLKKQSIMDPKMRHRAFFTLTEKVNLEAARPRVRPFGNFRKFSL